MKLFEIIIDFPKEKIEQAIITACSPFKSREISANGERKIAIWNIKNNEEPQLMALLYEIKNRKYQVCIWGELKTQEQIMDSFIKYLNIPKDRITYLKG